MSILASFFHEKLDKITEIIKELTSNKNVNEGDIKNGKEKIAKIINEHIESIKNEFELERKLEKASSHYMGFLGDAATLLESPKISEINFNMVNEKIIKAREIVKDIIAEIEGIRKREKELV